MFDEPYMLPALVWFGTVVAVCCLVWAIVRIKLTRDAHRSVLAEVWDTATLMHEPTKPSEAKRLLADLRSAPLDLDLWRRAERILRPALDEMSSSEKQRVAAAVYQPSGVGRSRYIARVLSPDVERMMRVVPKVDAVQGSEQARAEVIRAVKLWSTQEFNADKPPAPRHPIVRPASQQIECRICTDVICTTAHGTCPYCGLFAGIWSASKLRNTDGDQGSERANQSD